jgi:hypothetical protein
VRAVRQSATNQGLVTSPGPYPIRSCASASTTAGFLPLYGRAGTCVFASQRLAGTIQPGAQELTIAREPDLPPRADDPPTALTFAFDGGYARRTRKGPCRNFEILTRASEKNGKIRVFATVFQGSKSLRERLSRFVGRVGHDNGKPTALMTDGAESLLRLKRLLPVRPGCEESPLHDPAAEFEGAAHIHGR